VVPEIEYPQPRLEVMFSLWPADLEGAAK